MLPSRALEVSHGKSRGRIWNRPELSHGGNAADSGHDESLEILNCSDISDWVVSPVGHSKLGTPKAGCPTEDGRPFARVGEPGTTGQHGICPTGSH